MLRLEFERRKNGLTQKELERKTGIYAPDICKIENERMKPYPKQLKKLSQFFKVSEDELLKEM